MEQSLARRLTILIVSLLLALGANASAALGWSNGPAADGKAGYGYGTHDWILEHAIEIAGSDAEWVDADTAMWHTNDPDYFRTNSDWHLFRNTGKSRGGPQAVADHYYAAVVALQEDDPDTASRELGLLSHYYADMLVPFHTTYDAISHPALHTEYELAVDEHHRRFSEASYWVDEAEARPVTDVRERAISAAKFSRGKYSTLLYSFARNSDVRENRTVDNITGELMSRAINDLADIIRAAPSGDGVSSSPAKLVASVSNSRPIRGRKVCAYAKCTDSNGRILEGIRVDFYWPKAGGGTTKVSAYTDSKGIAHNWRTMSTSLPVGKKLTVKAVARSSGDSISASRSLALRRR